MKFTNIQADGQITNADPDALGDDFLIDDYLRDRNYILGKCLQAIRSISPNPSTEFQILYGGLVTDAGSGRVNISEGAAIGQDADGNPRLIVIPSLSNVSLPSGWNDNRTIWVTGVYAYKLSSETRQHFNGETYNYVLEDSYVGESNPLDLFTDSDPGSDVVKFGVFKMNGTTFSAQTGKSINLSFNPIPLGAFIEDPFDQLDASRYKNANAGSFNRADAPELLPLLLKTVSSITPATDRINVTGHGRSEGDLVKFGFSGGGITALTEYFVRNPTTNDFQVSLTKTGSIIDLTSDQTGEMLTNVLWGFGNGSTTLNTPDARGLFLRGAGVNASKQKANGSYYDGGSVGQIFLDKMIAHGHQMKADANSSNSSLGTNPFALDNITINIYRSGGIANTNMNAGNIKEAIANGQGTPREGDETAPASVAVNYKVRIA